MVASSSFSASLVQPHSPCYCRSLLPLPSTMWRPCRQRQLVLTSGPCSPTSPSRTAFTFQEGGSQSCCSNQPAIVCLCLVRNAYPGSAGPAFELQLWGFPSLRLAVPRRVCATGRCGSLHGHPAIHHAGKSASKEYLESGPICLLWFMAVLFVDVLYLPV